MSSFEELRGRVDQAVVKLSSANDVRRDQNQSLQHLLADLETKYHARTEELAYCATRIEALTTENAQLTDMVEQLVGILETYNTGSEEDPIYQASAIASGLLDTWSETKTAAGAAVATPLEHDTVVPQQARQFEDVSDDQLAIENLLETPEGWPEPVVEAHDRASPLEGFEPSEIGMVGQTTVEDDIDDNAVDAEPIEIESAEVAAEFDVTEVISDAASTELEVATATREQVTVEPIVAVDSDATTAPATDWAAESEALDNDLELIDRTVAALEAQVGADTTIEDLASELDIPEHDVEPEPEAFAIPDDEDTEASIRAMMARLERAAARAQALAAASNEAPPSTVDESEKVA